jgi:hypothetical protein
MVVRPLKAACGVGGSEADEEESVAELGHAEGMGAQDGALDDVATRGKVGHDTLVHAPRTALLVLPVEYTAIEGEEPHHVLQQKGGRAPCTQYSAALEVQLTTSVVAQTKLLARKREALAREASHEKVVGRQIGRFHLGDVARLGQRAKVERVRGGRVGIHLGRKDTSTAQRLQSHAEAADTSEELCESKAAGTTAGLGGISGGLWVKGGGRAMDAGGSGSWHDGGGDCGLDHGGGRGSQARFGPRSSQPHPGHPSDLTTQEQLGQRARHVAVGLEPCRPREAQMHLKDHAGACRGDTVSTAGGRSISANARALDPVPSQPLRALLSCSMECRFH